MGLNREVGEGKVRILKGIMEKYVERGEGVGWGRVWK